MKESDRKPSKIWVDNGNEFYNNSFKKWLKDNDIKMYWIHNDEKSVVAERFLRTLKTKIFEYITSMPKNVYIDKLDDIVDEYNNTYHRTVKIKPVDVKDSTSIDFKKDVNDKDPKFKVGDHVRISTHQTGLKKFFLLVKLKIQFHGHILLMISMVKKLLEHFMKKNCRILINMNLE